jgi:putative flippase GtrA
MLKVLLSDKRVRFILVGGLNTAFSYMLYALFIYFGISADIAIVMMYPLSIAHSYLWNKYFAFKSKKRSIKEMLIFVSVYVITFVINYLSIYTFVNVMDINEYIAGIISLATTALLSYIGHNLFTFSNNAKTETMNTK